MGVLPGRYRGNTVRTPCLLAWGWVTPAGAQGCNRWARKQRWLAGAVETSKTAGTFVRVTAWSDCHLLQAAGLALPVDLQRHMGPVDADNGGAAHLVSHVHRLAVHDRNRPGDRVDNAV
jgi:hypothetical protein